VKVADERAGGRVSAAAIGQLGKLLEASRLRQIADFTPIIEKIGLRKDKGMHEMNERKNKQICKWIKLTESVIFCFCVVRQATPPSDSYGEWNLE
jgi:hypothetical protein